MNSQEIEKIITEFFRKTELPLSEESFSFDEQNGSYWYSANLKGIKESLNMDEFLQSVNHIIRRIIDTQKKDEQNLPVVIIDINGHQKKKINNLRTVAHMMAERARYFKSKVEIDPMSSYDRRIIHEYLADKPDIKTESVGEGRERRVVVCYIEN